MYNAELIFQAQSATAFVNEYVEAPKVSTDYRIRLSIEEKTIAELKSPAQRKDLIIADGRLVSPRIMPTQFRTQRQARIEVFQAGANTNPLTGTVYIKPQLNSRLQLESVFGEYVQLEIRFD
ncbi:MAG: hypothetical protein RLZZ171_986 [Cyanobacteriota bacterium]|jgi:hypothetical protein